GLIGEDLGIEALGFEKALIDADVEIPVDRIRRDISQVELFELRGLRAAAGGNRAAYDRRHCGDSRHHPNRFHCSSFCRATPSRLVVWLIQDSKYDRRDPEIPASAWSRASAGAEDRWGWFRRHVRAAPTGPARDPRAAPLRRSGG